MTERTEGSSIIIRNDSSAPYCGLTASSSQAVRLFVRSFVVSVWMVRLFESMYFSVRKKKQKTILLLDGKETSRGQKKVDITER